MSSRGLASGGQSSGVMLCGPGCVWPIHAEACELGRGSKAASCLCRPRKCSWTVVTEFPVEHPQILRNALRPLSYGMYTLSYAPRPSPSCANGCEFGGLIPKMPVWLSPLAAAKVLFCSVFSLLPLTPRG